MDNAILLQKQVRENSEDLQKELRDMRAWEEQMKKKDLEIRNLKDTHKDLPPIRKKKKKRSTIHSQVSKDVKPTKAKRISGFDYGSWDKFDVDKACEEVDEQNDLPKETEETVYQIPHPSEKLEKEHEEALKLKEDGNFLVKNQQYAKAVGKYSDAIKIYPHDAVFYANRALCQFKLNNLYCAESDCTEAIRRDSTYVKAYHRRANARIELKRYKDAKEDIEKVLEIDPGNKEAKSLLAQVEKKLQTPSKSMIISGEEKEEKEEPSSIEKQIGAKLLQKSISSLIQNEKPNPSIKSKIIEIEEIDSTTSKDENIIEEGTSKEKNHRIEKEEEKKASENKSISNDATPKSESTLNEELPAWMPKLKDGFSIIQSPKEIPRRLNQSMKRIPVKEVPMNESIFKGVIAEVNKEKADKLISNEDDISKVRNTEPEKKTPLIECISTSTSNAEIIESLPPPPKSSVAFLLNWRKNTSIDFRYKYLKQIIPKDIPDIFKDSMESNIFSDILSILNTKFIQNSDKVYDFLNYLAKVKRFRALILFMTQRDKEALNHLFEHCKAKEMRTNEDIECLQFLYEV